MDGQFRTVTQDPPTDEDGNALLLDTQYRIENREGKPGKSPFITVWVSREIILNIMFL